MSRVQHDRRPRQRRGVTTQNRSHSDADKSAPLTYRERCRVALGALTLSSVVARCASRKSGENAPRYLQPFGLRGRCHDPAVSAAMAPSWFLLPRPEQIHRRPLREL